MKKILCIRHFIRPEGRLWIEGVGNCLICKPDENNKICRCYYPIAVTIEECKCD